MSIPEFLISIRNHSVVSFNGKITAVILNTNTQRETVTIGGWGVVPLDQFSTVFDFDTLRKVG